LIPESTEPAMQNSRDQEPLVSICIPVFNGEKTIAKTIGSLLNQTYTNIEIFVVDNCSSDFTVRIVQEFNDARITLIRNDIHLPRAEYNWNRCFYHARGEFLAIFHADDVYLPRMVSRQVETFKKYPGAGSIFTQGNIIDENDEIIGEFQLPPKMRDSEPHSYAEIFSSALEYADFLPSPTAMLRRDLYTELSPFRYDQFGSASDFDLWLRAAARAPVVILNEKLINYRVSKTQGSFGINKLRTGESDFFKVMDYHLEHNKETRLISAHSIDSYEVLRMGDQIIRAWNSLQKRDWKQFSDQVKNIPWAKYAKILIRNPKLLHSKYQLYSYFRIFKIYN
jgi:glycosyltransferase involved in cell wall biosynthesis